MIFGIKHLLKVSILYVFKKTIEQIYRNMCLLICKFVVIAYLSVQNILNKSSLLYCYHFMFEILNAMYVVQYIYVLGDELNKP